MEKSLINLEGDRTLTNRLAINNIIKNIDEEKKHQDAFAWNEVFLMIMIQIKHVGMSMILHCSKLHFSKCNGS
jgi:hypothetical protein